MSHSLPFTRKLRSILQAGLLACPVFGCLPIPISRNSGEVCQNFFVDSQLRVQLSFFTRFPINPNPELLGSEPVNFDAAKE